MGVLICFNLFRTLPFGIRLNSIGCDAAPAGPSSYSKISRIMRKKRWKWNCPLVQEEAIQMRFDQEDERQSSLLANNINHPNDFGHWLYEQAFEALRF